MIVLDEAFRFASIGFEGVGFKGLGSFGSLFWGVGGVAFVSGRGIWNIHYEGMFL